MEHIVINDHKSSFGPPADFVFPQRFPFQPTEVNDRVLRFIDFSTQAKGEDEEFAMVDTKLQSKNKLLSRKGMLANAWNKGKQQVQGKQQQQVRPQQRKIYREASVQVKSSWKIEAELSKQHFDKLTFNPPEPTDLKMTDSILRVNSGLLATVSAKRPRSYDLQEGEDKAKYLTTSNDPVMQELIKAEAGNVFLTDSILATLMTVLRSVYSWDITVTKTGNKLVFDKVRNGLYDEMSVNENADVTPEDEENSTVINHAKNLAEECLRVNLAFKKIALVPPPIVLGEKHDEESETTQAYRYRKWTLNDRMQVIVRTEVDAYIHEQTSIVYEKLRALNEYDASISGGYRANLGAQSGKVLGIEFHNNGNKLSKWTLEALFAGVESMRLGFFVRNLITRADKHSLVGVSKFHVSQLATNLNLSIPNCWGIFVGLLDLLLSKPDGKYVLLKDPNRQILRLYATVDEQEEDQLA